MNQLEVNKALSGSTLHSQRIRRIHNLINIFNIIKCTYWVTDNIFVMEYTRWNEGMSEWFRTQLLAT